jgi:pimeloyl-ACP methyl ester carboxylesterase
MPRNAAGRTDFIFGGRMLPSFFTDDDAGTPLLLCHAFPLNAAMWEAQRHSLAEYCRMITFDLPGFGRGGPAVEGMDMRDCADMAVSLLDHLGIEKAVIGGCSMGGYIAMTILRYYPERVMGLLLANTRAGADSDEGRKGRMEQIARIDDGELESVLEGLLPRLVGASTKNVAPEVVAFVRELSRSASGEGCAAMLRAMADREDSREVLASCRIPVCSIGGEEDVLIPPSEAELIAALAQDSELHLIPNAGHLSNIERPIRFAIAVRHFLSRFS